MVLLLCHTSPDNAGAFVAAESLKERSTYSNRESSVGVNRLGRQGFGRGHRGGRRKLKKLKYLQMPLKEQR